MLQNFPATGLRCSSFGTGATDEKYSKLKFKKVKISCIIKANQPNVLRLKSERNTHIFGSVADESRCAITVQPQLRVGLCTTGIPRNIFGCGSLGGGIRLSSPYYEAFARRSFSKIPKAVMNKNGNSGVTDGRTGGNTLSKIFNKNWKQAKGSAVQRKNVKRKVAVAASIQAKGSAVQKKNIKRKVVVAASNQAAPNQAASNQAKGSAVQKKNVKRKMVVAASNQAASNQAKGSAAQKKNVKHKVAVAASNQAASTQTKGLAVQKKNVKRKVVVAASDQAASNQAKGLDLQSKNVKRKVAVAASNQAKGSAVQKKNVKREVVVAASNQALGKSGSNSKISAVKDVDMVNSGGQPVGNGMKNLKQQSSKTKANGKLKQQSRSKTSGEQSLSKLFNKNSGTNAVSDVAAEQKNSKRASQAKSQNLTKNNQSPAASENNSTGNTPVKVIDSSVSAKPQSKKTTGKTHKKGKPIKGANVLVKSIEELQASSAHKSQQKHTPQVTGKAKTQGRRTTKHLYPATGKSVVVVESVTKAKVIQGYLGDMYEVIPSYGHVRDLAARSGSVRPDDDFSMVWEVPAAAWTHLKSIKVSLSGAENLILASDPDREGEAIAWHIIEMLLQQDALPEDITVARVVFNEITESSIKSALQTPRDIDVNLVHAYLARRALDYLIGFSISPLLWRKLPGCQSAGRVQSAALSLVCDREMEIDEFKPQEYWTVEVFFKKMELGSSVNNSSFSSYLTHLHSKKVNQLSISSLAYAKDIEQKINLSNFEVIGSKRNKMRKNPPIPYITSSLQQDAANKLNFPATYTMKLAQKLYEGIQLSNGKAAGLITYTRTDGLNISNEAAKDICSLIIERYGQSFASETPRKYFKKVKNAQEAHEAIRPTDIRSLPSMLAGVLDADSLKLYALIWARTVACQMEPAIIDQLQVDIQNAGHSIVFRSACSRVEFLGYRAVYGDLEAKAIKYNENEGNDREENFKVLSNLKQGDPLCLCKVELNEHHTQPPPRYNEGSLVKKLEELGIGRPSTYATTLKVLKDRNYVTVKSRTLYPEFRGRMVSAFLSNHFSEVTDYSFTADMETELDNVSAGFTEWKGLLRDYWTRFSKFCDQAAKVHIHEVEKMLEKTFGDFLFASLPDESRTCPSCQEGTLIFKVSRFGAGYFIGCDQHPKCKYIAKTLYGDDDEEDAPQNNNTAEEPKVLGLNPGSNEKVLLKNGPYGYYVQLGEDRKGYTPKRSSICQIKNVDSITLDDALEFLRFPLTIGNHPEDGQPIVIKVAKSGYSIRHRRSIAPVPKNMKAKDITLEKAVKLLSSKDVKKCGRPKNKPKREIYETA
ncbi:uncharacterized protein LOC132308787 isoform X2 [Cornus florida]|nr:uncharacterized protein LOC132308787 isoform X2 [Cornus florida]